MANLRQIKRHIASVQSIARVTNAMEVVSTAKNVRLESRLANSRLFATKSWEVLTHLASAAEPDVQTNPLFCGYREGNLLPQDRVGMVLITSNKGLVSSFNHNLLAQVRRYVERTPATVEAITLGRQGRLAMLRGTGLDASIPIHADLTLAEEKVELDDLTPVAQIVIDGFVQQRFNEVVMIYTQYHAGSRMEVTTRPLLPICPEAPAERRHYVFEPEPQELLRSLIPRVIRFQLFDAYLESLMAENASRMAAMHAAAQNASELTRNLTMAYNKARQETINAELADLLGGRLSRTGDDPALGGR
jgi:F-type H+-transporting ATPase subunit gamma